MRKHCNYQGLTDIYIKHSFTKGMGRVLDVGSTTNKQYYFKNRNQSDKNALLSDWKVVGDDIRRAMSDSKK